MATAIKGFATPLGVKKSLSEVTSDDVALSRQARQIYCKVLANGGQKVVAGSGKRITADQVKEWPIVNTFPPPGTQITPAIFFEHCGAYTILPYFWKHQAMLLKLPAAPEFHKWDLNSEGALPQGLECSGMAATEFDQHNVRRFVVWNGKQLHGDVGERLGYQKVLKSRAWNAMHEAQYPGQMASLNGKRIQYQCLGDVCPPDYMPPPDWDVLGKLPPIKKQRIFESPSAPPITPKGSQKELSLLPTFKTSAPGPSKTLENLEKEVARLKLANRYADQQIVALMKFSERHDHAVDDMRVVAIQYISLIQESENTSLIDSMDEITSEMNEILKASHVSLTTIAEAHPSLGNLIGYHVGKVGEIGTEFDSWIRQESHILGDSAYEKP